MAKLKGIDEAIDEVVEYIEGRMHGTITSLHTGFRKLDMSMIDGLEWNSMLTIGGRPSVGKSAFSDCIVDGCFTNNLENGYPNFILLDFNWELSARVMLLRRLSSRVKQTYKYIISADNNTINKKEFQDMVMILRDHYGKLPITFCEEPLTIKEFVETVESFCLANPGKKVLIRVDHTLLTKMTAAEGNQVMMLLNLLMAANSLKKKWPVAFIFLTQVNREFEERQLPGDDKAFPRQGDVYGGDAAAMFSETIILLNKPSKYNVRQYGARNGLINFPIEKDDLFAHIVKNRNGESDIILHYKENFKNMSIKEY